MVPVGRKNTKDTATNIEIEAETFNKYVNNGSGYLFNEKCTTIHGLHPTHKRMVSTYKMVVVWNQFKECIQYTIDQEKTVTIVSYNGEKYDILWLWKLTQAPHFPFYMPDKIKYFIDSYQTIGNYRSS